MHYRLLFLFLLLTELLQAQEIVSVLQINSELSKKTIHYNAKSSISLPFVDDFHYDAILPDSMLWQDHNVFINRNYPDNPVTIGVATFDGLNAEGLAYDISQPTTWGEADVLTSQPINLAAVDSAYIMFYYQPQGIGDNPQPSDSLVLEFATDSAGIINWNYIWSVPGTTVHEFQKKVFLITTTEYLRSDFQFRFRNYATLSGNYDHWHIDYVVLDTFDFTIASDTALLNDMAFVYDCPSFLKHYREMPWTHFKDDMVDELKDSIDILIRNNNANSLSDFQINLIVNMDTSEVYPLVNGNFFGPRDLTIPNYTLIGGNFSFLSTPGGAIEIYDDIFTYKSNDSDSFLFQNIITGQVVLDSRQNNDTLYHSQNFYNHFAYDDGTAEFAYGINVQGAMAAMQFKLNRPDTLRAVQMYFPQMLDSVNNIPFYLTVWDDNNGDPGNILYSKQEYPQHTTNKDFHYYYIDSLFELSGTFYVGWQQTTTDLLNIGLDRNSPSNDYMFYHVGGGWNTSQFPGAWMIRPLVGQEELILTLSQQSSNSINIYPNPFDDITTITTKSNNNTIILYDMNGNKVQQFFSASATFHLHKSGLNAGMYFVSVYNDSGVSYHKLVIQ